MKKLKTIFSPRNLIVWLFALVLVFTVPKLNEPIMSDTDAIVTMMCVDEKDGKVDLAVSVLAPAEGKTPKYEIYSGSGESIGEATDNISLMLGKDVAFAQCEILAVGENVSNTGIMKVLDYMTRTKKVGRNAYLIQFTGEPADFGKAITTLSMNKSIGLEKVLSFDERYVLAQDSNVEEFYIGYYSPVSLGIVPLIKLETEETDNSIEVSSSGSGGSSSSGGQAQQSASSSGGQEEKQYIVNDGTMTMFKFGKKHLELAPEMVKKANFFINNSQKGTLIIKNVKDELYDDVNAVINILKKKTKLKPKFENGIPVMDANVEMTVFVEEVEDNTPTKNMLHRNQDFLTDAVIKKIKEKVTADMEECITYCKENDIDLLGVFKNFYSFKNREFEEYFKRTGEKNYLDAVKFNINVKVNSEY